MPNVIGTNNLLSIYKNSQFIFFSTGSVYGTGEFDELKEISIGNIDFLIKCQVILKVKEWENSFVGSFLRNIIQILK